MSIVVTAFPSLTKLMRMPAVRKNAPRPQGTWLSLNQAAMALGMSRLKVLVRALRGELVHGFVGKNVVISTDSIEAALAQDSATP